jgi:starch synthase
MNVLPEPEIIVPDLEIPMGTQGIQARVRRTFISKDLFVYFIEREEFFDRKGLYGGPMGDYFDNFERFTFLSRGALELARRLDFIPDIIHCNDWQTGLVPALLRDPNICRDRFNRTSTLFTIHNMGYQGIFPKEKFHITNLTEPLFFHPEGVEYWDNISLLKSGINYSDAVTTVSPTYAEEIQTPEFGMGMEGVLEKRADSLSGILNGVDYSVWNPERDGLINAPYNMKKKSGKKKCKEGLIKEMKLDSSLKNRPLFGIISRMDFQKGLDILLNILDRVMALDCGLSVLGSGDRDMEKAFIKAAERYRGRIFVSTGFNDPLAHRIMAGCDMFLVPSRYEPCGLTQLYALKYGTVPIVRATGGLNDTITEFNGRNGNGFKFDGYEPSSLLAAIKRAVHMFADRNLWRSLMSNGMKENFSWDLSAERYMKLYRTLVVKKSGK